MKGFVEMKCTTLGIETTCRLEGVGIADKAHLFQCLKKALEVDALEWHLISGYMEFLEQDEPEPEPGIVGRARDMGLNVEDKGSGVFINGEQNKMKELLKELLEDKS